MYNPEDNKIARNGTKMEFSSMFNARCDGIEVDVLKSWFQKAIRRGIKEDALYAGLRLFQFQYRGGFEEERGEKWRGRAVYSNLLRRAIVITGEDIGIGALGVIPLVDKCVEGLRKDDSLETFPQRIRTFIHLVCLLCGQPKSRLVSTSKVLATDEMLTPQLREWAEEVEKETEDPVERVVYVLDHRDRDELFAFLAVRYAHRLYVDGRKEKIERGLEKKRKILSPLVYKLWNIYLDGKSPLVQTLYKWFQRENENLIYLILATLIFIVPDVNWGYVSVDVVDTDTLYRQAMSERRSPPEWAVDKHTREGRVKGKGTLDFALEGAKINSPWRYSPVFLEGLYLKSKTLSVAHPPGKKKKKKSLLSANASADSHPHSPRTGTYSRECVRQVMDGINVDPGHTPRTGTSMGFRLTRNEVEEILKAPRGQILTSKNKRPVFLTRTYAYKGPWDNTERMREKFDRLGERMRNFRTLGTKVVPMEFGGDEDGNLWIRSPTLAENPFDEWRVEEKDDTILGVKVQVVVKESMGVTEMNRLRDEDIAGFLFGEDFLFRSYIDAALLGVGDQNLRNSLVVSGKPFLIDWEDNSGRKSINGPAGVFSKTTKRLEKIIRLGLEKFDMEDEVRKYIRSLGDRDDLVYERKNLEMLQGMMI